MMVIYYKVSDEKSGTLFFCPNGLSRSIRVWIKANSRGKISKKLGVTNNRSVSI